MVKKFRSFCDIVANYTVGVSSTVRPNAATIR